MKIIICMSLTLAAQFTFAAEQALTYRPVIQIPIKGHGGWDALTVDTNSHLLFVSQSDRVVVIDTENSQVQKEIMDTPGVHAIAVAVDLGKAFVSDGKENKVSVIDLLKLSIKSKILVGENPDLIVYEPLSHEVYAFNGKGPSVSVINATSEKVIETTSLPGKPEFAVVDSAEHRVFVNIENKNELVGLDTRTHKVASTWPLTGCESPSGLAQNLAASRLFVVCENKKMLLVDSTSGKVLATAAIGEGADGAAYDEKLNLAFAPNGKSGTVTILRVDGNKNLTVVQTLQTQIGARTIALDPDTHRIYLPTANFAKAEGGKRPQPIDGTQRVLVYGP